MTPDAAATWTLLSWNVNGRIGESCGRQLERVLERSPEVLALQEVTLTNHPSWCEGLAAAGYSVLSTIDLVRLPYPDVTPQIRRKNFNLIASRFAIAQLAGLTFEEPEEARLAFPEKYLAARVAFGPRRVEIHNAHLPPGSTRGAIKIQAFRAIRRRVDQPTKIARVLCGDFNTPQVEDPDSVTTWSSAHRSIGAEWDEAERGVLEHPALRDVYRQCAQAARHHSHVWISQPPITGLGVTRRQACVRKVSPSRRPRVGGDVGRSASSDSRPKFEQ